VEPNDPVPPLIMSVEPARSIPPIP
jgi:hypothetical protein